MPETDLSLLTRAIEQNPFAVLITDLSGSIVYVNARFSALTGYSLAEIAGKNPRILSSGETSPEVYRALWEILRKGEVWQGDLLNKTKNGQAFWESISIAPIKDADGRVSHFIGIWNDSTERKQSDERIAKNLKELKYQSQTDVLTGQYNRRYVFEELEKEVERSRRYKRKLSGMMIDVDDFKLINDRYGHLTGDRVLKTFAAIISKSIRKIDILGRYGGDEFLVLLPEATLETAHVVARRIQKNLEDYQENVLADLGRVTASIGLISFDAIQDSHQAAFIERIDLALLQSKKVGKNTITKG